MDHEQNEDLEQISIEDMPTDDSVPLILQRRSAQAFDPNHQITFRTLQHILEVTLTQTSPHLFAGMVPNIHLLVFVHRVDGLASGLYMLTRNAHAQAALQRHCRQEFDWVKPDGLPEHLPLYHLVSANGQKVARTVACHQAIASEGMFSIAMLAEFEDNLTIAPWQYRRLHWEAGLVGQMIYLAAEAHGLRGTGIGCFFDDSIHELLGMDSLQYQCLYEFTVGVPVIDSRIANLPAYGHLSA
jgi:nitroreductase